MWECACMSYDEGNRTVVSEGEKNELKEDLSFNPRSKFMSLYLNAGKYGFGEMNNGLRTFLGPNSRNQWMLSCMAT